MKIKIQNEMLKLELNKMGKMDVQLTKRTK